MPTSRMPTLSKGSGRVSGKGGQLRALGRPALRYRPASRRTDQLVRPSHQLRVRPPLQLFEIEPGLFLRIDGEALITHPPLDLALALRLAWRARVDVKTQRRRITTITLVDHAPGAGALDDRRLLIVDAHGRRHAAQPTESLGMAAEPGEHALALRPDDRVLAAVRQDHLEGEEILRLAANDHALEMSPIRLRLRPRRRLDPAPRPQRRRRVALRPEPLHRP